MKSVVICGSKRFREEILNFADELAEMGVVVYEPSFRWLEKWTEEEWAKLSDDIKKAVVMGLTCQHYRKIDLADVVFVFNRDGYIGNSVNQEIGYAAAKAKPIYSLETDDDLGRQFLIDKIAPFPGRLAELLGYSASRQAKKKITICGSVKFRKEMVEARDRLNEMGYEGIICQVMEDLALGKNPELLKKIEENHAQAKKEGGFIKWYYNSIVQSDAILVLNYDKGDIKNYIGGNTLMEMAFAHVHDKRIFLLNPAPEIGYRDEIIAMDPIILNNDLSKISF
ncbi:MAG: hypothetical protein PHU56_02940 [Candidatus Pacebacteria bacterium]|nr:hypothetical protein [Candidatus Paceibacterota bacterium]